MKTFINVIAYISIISLTLLTSFCTTDNSEKKILPEYELVVEDTISIDYIGNLSVVDYQQESSKYLAVDKSKGNQVILVFNEKNEILSNFDNLNAGNNSFKGSLNSISFSKNKNEFLILSDAGLYSYDSTWQIKLFHKNPNSQPKFLNPYFSIEHFDYKDKVFFISSYNFDDVNFNYLQKEFFQEIQNLTLIDTTSGTFDTFVHFEQNSPYLSKSRLLPPYITHFSFNHKHSNLNVLYSQDPTIYQYQFNGKEFIHINSYKLNLDEFKLNEGNYENDDYDAFKTAMDSRINRMVSIEDKTYITYLKAMNQSKFESLGIDYGDSEEYNQFIFSNYVEAISIFQNGKKISRDITLPDYLTGPHVVIGPNKLLMAVPKFKYESSKEVFYIINVLPKL
ncbi:hypothetical protein SAMN04489724_2777 [Algoriphagus locisalis]|uniref:6-bladed beta-propeller protein n=1 Tax=Algoriphagus locisalis TaxID=305507 RepID=A0A1I7BWE6_9BACT|nr:hypothetical protein [Algoriphagus locisalis]SFT91513.1 hypothetical protein SAMN04489724_2777 [Algoriphagus locisalis]